MNVFLGLYVLVIAVAPALILGIVLNSFCMFAIAIIIHGVLLYKVPIYMRFWRWLTYGLRILYTNLFLRFVFHLSQAHGIKTTYADVSDARSVEDFYSDKKRSVRRRMTTSIPKKIAEAEVTVNYISSNWITLDNLKVQYAQAKKHDSKLYPIWWQVLTHFALAGTVTEYRIKGKLIGQNISFLRGDSFTILQYGSLEEAARIGLWFFNIFENIKQAIFMKAKLVNGTIEAHKGEAKSNAGLTPTDDEELVFRLYGGKFSNLPRGFSGSSDNFGGNKDLGRTLNA